MPVIVIDPWHLFLVIVAIKLVNDMTPLFVRSPEVQRDKDLRKRERAAQRRARQKYRDKTRWYRVANYMIWGSAAAFNA